ncbi:MAG: N-acetyltransferase [Bacteroidia bacterium]|nr:N-acetyltransferase [Bacteroidia bacterium]MDW8346654.1 DapH/DapD/GlmU-related protein [Bacteroidia bacterium]
MKFKNKNIYVSGTANIGKNVKIGDNTVIYDNVVIGDNSIIADNCVIGEPLHNYYSDVNTYENPKTIIGKNAVIRSFTIIYASCEIGDNFTTGHRATIREYTKIGNHCSVGTNTDIQGYTTFGNYCRLHSQVFVAQRSEFGNFVFVYPGVIITDDPHPPSNISKGVIAKDYAQIGAGSVILSGVILGENCLIGAHSFVNKDVMPYSLVAGNPAKFIKDVREIRSKDTSKSHYPWMYNFERNMPWAGIGYEAWLESQKSDEQK